MKLVPGLNWSCSVSLITFSLVTTASPFQANAGGAQTLEEAQKAFLEARARADSLQAQLDQALKAAASGDTDRLRAQAQAAQEQLDAERVSQSVIHVPILGLCSPHSVVSHTR